MGSNAADNGIAIFVSHRIDLDSKTIDNPMYYNMRCGAVYDERGTSTIPGDDTGDNISKLRIPFCEFTVQYWAWKNFDAEYYGLCHYRRYLSFSNKFFPANDYRVDIEKKLDSETVEKLQLFNYAKMEAEIHSHDVIVGCAYDTKKLKRVSPKESVLEMWLEADNLVEDKALYFLFDLVRELSPEYVGDMEAYLASNKSYGYNCYVMKKELFQKLCEFQFGVLFEFYKRFDMSGYEGNMQRTPGYLGEILFGIFMHHIQSQGRYDIKEKQIAFFEDTLVGKGDRVIRWRRENSSDGPSTPMITSIKAGSHKVKLVWNPVAGAEMYRVYSYRKGKYTRCCTTMHSTTATVTDLDNDRKYGFVVSVKANGVWSDYRYLTDLIYAVPAEARSEITSVIPGDGCVELKWCICANAERYCVYYYDNGNCICAFSTTGTSGCVKLLENGVSYDFGVCAKVNGRWKYFGSTDKLVSAVPTAEKKTEKS